MRGTSTWKPIHPQLAWGLPGWLAASFGPVAELHTLHIKHSIWVFDKESLLKNMKGSKEWNRPGSEGELAGMACQMEEHGR